MNILHGTRLSICTALAVTVLMVLFAGNGTANATDLSGGIKGLKVGMQKAKVFSMLESMEKLPGGVYALSCKPDTDGERCDSWGWNLTYGNIPVALYGIHFGRSGLDEVWFLLSMAGCDPKNTNELHPKLQLDKISSQLTQHIGPPTNVAETGKVWIDDTAALKVKLIGPDPTHPMYPNCPGIHVEYVSRARLAERLKQNQAERANEKDL